MADDPDLARRVRDALGGVPDVVEKRMFGSLGFLVRGTLRIGVGSHPDHVMMVRVGAAADEALARPGARAAVMRGRTMSGWAFLNRSAVGTEEDIAFWVSTALASVPE